MMLFMWRRLLQTGALVAAVTTLLGSTVLGQNGLPGDFSPGDGVRVLIWQTQGITTGASFENLGINGNYIIDNSGKIFLPLIGDVRAVGLTKEVLADTLARRYRKFATGITVVCKPLIRIAVFGSVGRPGSYLVEEKASLWEVIDLAGGPQSNADLKKIYFTRAGKTVGEKLLNQFERAANIQEIGMQSGDQLYVPGVRRLQFVTILQYLGSLASILLLYFQIQDRVSDN